MILLFLSLLLLLLLLLVRQTGNPADIDNKQKLTGHFQAASVPFAPPVHSSGAIFYSNNNKVSSLHLLLASKLKFHADMKLQLSQRKDHKLTNDSKSPERAPNLNLTFCKYPSNGCCRPADQPRLAASTYDKHPRNIHHGQLQHNVTRNIM